MTRATVVAALWCVLTRAVTQQVQVAGPGAVRLALFWAVATALTCLALWLELGAEGSAPARSIDPLGLDLD